ncbi:MAG: redoxin domain-containing protein [Anaerolineales bacterium]|nr:redoxin domain-containing protein [Anaerolineales bacterium]
MRERITLTSDWKKFLIVVVVAVVALAGFSLRDFSDLEPAQSPGLGSDTAGLEIAPAMGALAPDFTLFDLQGEEVSLSDFHGQPVLINFWATWCGPCRLEMPAIQSRYERYKDDGLVVLAVDFDEPAGDVESFRDELGLTFPLLLDPGAKVQKLYRNRSYPSSFFVDADGVIQVQHIGVMTEGQIDENLAQIGVGP